MNALKKITSAFLLVVLLFTACFPAALGETGQEMPADLPEIETQPASVTVAEGRTATFQVKAKNADAYQWQYRKGADKEWADYQGKTANTDTIKIKATKKHDGYEYRCVITGEKGSQTISDAAVLTYEPLIFGFDLTEQELAGKMTQLLSKAPKWTRKTAPQTLDKFPILSKELDNLFSMAKKAKSSLKNKGNVYTWTTDIDGVIQIDSAELTRTASIEYSTEKGQMTYIFAAEMEKTGDGKYRIDFSSAPLAEGCTLKNITIGKTTQYLFTVSYSESLKCEYGFTFYPKGTMDPKKESMRMFIGVHLFEADGETYLQFSRATSDQNLQILFAHGDDKAWQNYHLTYNPKTKKLADYRKTP